jgi:hypothetical protein
MKTYLVFAYDDYYPGGGMSDLKHATTSEAEARAMAAEISQKRWYVEIWAVDAGEVKEVFSWMNGDEFNHP